VRHFLLTRGEINYNDKKTPLEADLYNLGTDIHFDLLATRYSGTISYDNGHLQYAGYSPLPHNFTAKFTATRLCFHWSLPPEGWSFRGFAARGCDQLRQSTVAGDYDIHIHTQDFAAMSPAVAPAGDVSLAAEFIIRM